MNEEKAQKVAHNIHQLSMGLFDLTLQVTNSMLILHDIQTRITDSAILIEEIVGDLPDEVREKTVITSMGELAEKKLKGSLSPKKATLAELIRQILGGGHTHE